jgi:DNA polymerase I-like protein with 3'-5' exonuclease and polymerase domains
MTVSSHRLVEYLFAFSQNRVSLCLTRFANQGQLRKHQQAIEAKLALLSDDAAELLGRPIMLSSNQQVAHALFTELKLSAPKALTAGGALSVTKVVPLVLESLCVLGN